MGYVVDGQCAIQNTNITVPGRSFMIYNPSKTAGTIS